LENIVGNEDSQSIPNYGLSNNQDLVDAQIEQDTIKNKNPNALDELGEKIFLDRYALKDMAKNSLSVGDTVIVCVDLKTRRREIGTVKGISDSIVTVELRDGISVKCAMEHVDKPIELKPEQMMDRVARGIATVEEEKADEWFEKFRWMMEGWKFVPAGRILTAAGTDQQLTYYNCFVLPSPRDSREGIVEILSNMMEIMSRGGGVGINLSSLRPRYCYVKGVNGRSSGAVSWGGLYSFTTGLIEQGGCLTPDTLVFTKHGVLRLDEIVKHKNRGWREQTLTVMTDEGERLSHQVFNNGVADVLRVETDMGLHLTGTPNHKVKIMTPSGPQWRRLDELQTRDAIIVQLGQHQGQIQALRKPIYHHHNQDAVTLPNILDEGLAFFLGYFMGDGFMTTKDGDWRLGVSVAHNSYLIKEMPALLRRLFPGVNVRIQQKDNDASLTYLISNRAVKEFLQLNGLDKAQSSIVVVPRLIRQSPPDVVGAFLRGLFEADGGLSHRYPTLSSTSKQLIDEVAVLLIGLGCPVKVEKNTTSENRYGCRPIWRLRIHSFRGLENWQRHIGCDSRSRFAVCLNVAPDKTKEITYKLPYSEYWLEPVLTEITLPQIDSRATEQRFKAIDQPLRRKLLRYLRGDRNLTLSAYDTLSQTHPDFAKAARPVNNLWFAFVERVTKAGQSLTLDLEVDDNHTYLANGMVTHNSRRGALILVLNDWHPDLMEFINSKREMGKITNANISVAISDDFMAAVKADADWNLEFPDTLTEDYDELWDGDLKKWKSLGKPVLVYKTLKARQIWNTIIESAWASAEPGVWFIDKANQMSNSYYFNSLACTNPCGEQSLPAWSVCDLGAINLSKFVVNGGVDWKALGRVIRYSVRFLDNVIEATPYFFEENHELQFSERRIGLNTMGLAEMLIRLGIRYGSKESLEFIDKLYNFIATESYLASADLAVEKGAFPKFDAERFLKSGYMQKMPDEVRKAIEEKGIRNVTILTQAPNGTVGTMVGTSTGIEPFYFWTHYRKSRLGTHEVSVNVVEEWKQKHPGEKLPPYFVTALDLTPEEHVNTQAAIQRWVDASISKTHNTPNDFTVEQMRELYELMYELGCKGGTVYRDGSRDEQVLEAKEETEAEENASDSADEKEVDLESKQLSSPVDATVKVRPRPYKRHGVTVSQRTPSGTAHITMNNDESEQPFEVFVEIGKGGSDIKAMAEAMGRLMSLLLRLASPVTPIEKVQEIVNQIRGIGGARSYGFGKEKVLSLPDAVGKALEEHYGVQGHDNHINSNSESPVPEIEHPHGVAADICPICGHAAFVRQEGCMSCHACGHSEC